MDDQADGRHQACDGRADGRHQACDRADFGECLRLWRVMWLMVGTRRVTERILANVSVFGRLMQRFWRMFGVFEAWERDFGECLGFWRWEAKRW